MNAMLKTAAIAYAVILLVNFVPMLDLKPAAK